LFERQALELTKGLIDQQAGSGLGPQRASTLAAEA